jgi:hypothetical protein
MYLDALLHGLEVVLQVTILRLTPSTHRKREGQLFTVSIVYYSWHIIISNICTIIISNICTVI